jgi:hypothetical protein
MSDDPKNGKERLAPVLKVTVEMRQTPEGIQATINGNGPPEACINALTQGIVAAARIGWVKQEQSLVAPVTGPLPPLRRIP